MERGRFLLDRLSEGAEAANQLSNDVVFLPANQLFNVRVLNLEAFRGLLLKLDEVLDHTTRLIRQTELKCEFVELY